MTPGIDGLRNTGKTINFGYHLEKSPIFTGSDFYNWQSKIQVAQLIGQNIKDGAVQMLSWG